MKKIICIANQKGGLGKTTTSVNLGACLALADQNVLLIDIDPQGNASTGLNVPKNQADDNIYSAFMGGEILDSMIFDTAVDKLKCIPSTTDLYGAEIELVNIDLGPIRGGGLRSVTRVGRYDACCEALERERRW